MKYCICLFSVSASITLLLLPSFKSNKNAIVKNSQASKMSENSCLRLNMVSNLVQYTPIIIENFLRRYLSHGCLGLKTLTLKPCQRLLFLYINSTALAAYFNQVNFIRNPLIPAFILLFTKIIYV